MIERADTRPLTVTVRASNKKTANSTCALQMVRLLYKEGLIEKFGEKPGSAPKALKKVEPRYEIIIWRFPYNLFLASMTQM